MLFAESNHELVQQVLVLEFGSLQWTMSVSLLADVRLQTSYAHPCVESRLTSSCTFDGARGVKERVSVDVMKHHVPENSTRNSFSICGSECTRLSDAGG